MRNDKDTQILMELYEAIQETMTFTPQGMLTSKRITTKDDRKLLIKLDYSPKDEQLYISTYTGSGVTGKNWNERKDLRIPVANRLEGSKKLAQVADIYQKHGFTSDAVSQISKY